ncbi:sodium-independent sulfate anion transporter isoform X2 [Phymastichus coffea]|uniref:sodium-independent sulfate anion transporter isoform X2 n=1 Tax=Phymastichus coffea TaxID=108790 RepID=UPI00273AD93F|nr:sodium-independent sulfate anion transporter isoform X2 [Phymastichus coffea]
MLHIIVVVILQRKLYLCFNFRCFGFVHIVCSDCCERMTKYYFVRRSEMRDRSKCDPKETLRRRLPIISWLPYYTWSTFLQDALAGATVGLTVIPQGIAYAVVAGLPPVYGLYSSFMGCFVYIFFGSTKDVTVGPTAIMGLLSVTFVRQYNEDFAVLLCFVSGIVITLMGTMKLGFLVDFISMPVISGFTNASSVIIASSQINTLFGIKGRSEGFIEAIEKFINGFMDIQPWDTVLGVSSIIVLVVLKNLPGKRHGNAWQRSLWILCLARNAVVVIFGMTLAYGLSFTKNGVPFVITGNITEGLPPFQLPPFSTTTNETYYDFMDMMRIFAKGKTLDSNQEMIAVGLCNVFGSFVRSMPTTGSFTRTAVNNASGVKTPMGGAITGCLVLLACGLLTSTFKFIPKATLAAVIIVAMYYMLEIKLFKVLWDTKKIDLIPLVVTLVACLSVGLEYGMLVGIATNLVLLLYGTARPGLVIEERVANEMPILFVSPQQSLSFPAAEYLREQVMSCCDIMKDASLVVIDGRNVTGIDTTVAKNLSLLLSDLESRKLKLLFWNWCEDTRKTLVAFDSSMGAHFRNSSSITQLVSDEMETSEAPREESMA